MTPMKCPEDTPQAFQSSWNTHDMPALGALFHEDASLVNRFGHYVRGVDAIVKLHFWSRLTAGAAHPAGPHAVDRLILAVLTRQAGAWRIKALENVTLTNPRTGETVLREHSSF